LNKAVERNSFKPVGSRFQARSAAATEKALSPVFRLVLGTTKSQLLDERSDDREGIYTSLFTQKEQQARKRTIKVTRPDSL